MSFLQPQLLFLLALVGVPIFVHLFNRQRAQELEFPAMRLLLRSAQETRKRLRLKQILSLLLRLLLIASFAIAIAGPFADDNQAQQQSALPEALLIVVDDSLSMKAADGRFEQALQLAREAAESWPGGEIAVVPASQLIDGHLPRLVEDKAALLATLDELEPGLRELDMTHALMRGVDTLRSAKNARRRLLILSDRAASSWPWQGLRDLVGGAAEVELVTLGEDPSNTAIVAAHLVPNPPKSTAGWSKSSSLLSQRAHKRGVCSSAKATLSSPARQLASPARAAKPWNSP